MKLKEKTRKIIALATVIILCLSMTACGGDGSDSKNPKEITLSQYLSGKDTHIIYALRGEGDTVNMVDKDDVPSCLYVFENGKVSVMKTELTFGDISKMSEDEIVSQSKPYSNVGGLRSPEDYDSQDEYEIAKQKYEEDVQRYKNMDYRIVVLTDGSGNNTDKEAIVIKYISSSGEEKLFFDTGDYHSFNYISKIQSKYTYTIYDSEFIYCILKNNYGYPNDFATTSSLWIKVPTGVEIVMDTPNTKGVIVDPELISYSFGDCGDCDVPTFDIFND